MNIWFITASDILYVWNIQQKSEQEKCEIKEVQEVRDNENNNGFSDVSEKEELVKEIQNLRSKLQAFADVSTNKSTDKLRSSLLLSRSIQLRKSGLGGAGGGGCQTINEEELEKERERWTEMESEWISLTDELRVDLESIRRRAEKVENELNSEKKCNEELEDALHRSVLGHARFVEHYAELQEKYNELVGKHRAIMGGIAEVKRAAQKAGSKGHGSRFSKSLAAELSALRFERDREREFLKKENKGLKVQLRDTAEAVHAAGELLVRLREAEHSASVAEVTLLTLCIICVYIEQIEVKMKSLSKSGHHLLRGISLFFGRSRSLRSKQVSSNRVWMDSRVV